MQASTPKPEDSSIRILKVGSCPSLSGKSTLTYHVGCKGQAEIYFRIYVNSGGGFHSSEWVAASDIQRALGTGGLVTSALLHPIFKKKSVNSAGFIFSVLKHEGLVARAKESRRYVRIESEAFVAEVKALIASKVSLDADAPAAKKRPLPKPTPAPIRTAAASARKAANRAAKPATK